MTRSGLRRALGALAVLTAALAVACGGDDGDGLATRIEDPFAGGYPMFEDADGGVRIVLGTPDLAVGERRISFALFERDQELIDAPEIAARIYRYPDGLGGERIGPLEDATLHYGAFPLGGRGIYRGHATFDEPGLYAIEADVPAAGESGDVHTVRFPVEVEAKPIARDIGEAAPASDHRTLADVGAIEELTTSYDPDPALYQRTIAEVLAASQPFVLVFASPAFCTTALCGPQVELLSEIAADHNDGGAAFIHVDLYENPHEIVGDLDRARRSPVLAEWGVETDQWTFVVDATGRITERFEGFVPRDELELALLAVLEP